MDAQTQAIVDAVITGHAAILTEMQHVEILLLAGVFLMVIMTGIMFVLSAWGVQRVTNRQAQFGQRIVDLEGKFNLLVDILLKAAEERMHERDG